MSDFFCVWCFHLDRSLGDNYLGVKGLRNRVLRNGIESLHTRFLQKKDAQNLTVFLVTPSAQPCVQSYRRFAYDEGMKKKFGSAETFERSPRCRIARDSRIRPQNRLQITVRGRKSSFTSILPTFTSILPTFSTQFGS